MKLWEIVKGMMDGKYHNGSRFTNGFRDMVIINNELLWCYTKSPVTILLNDVSEWEVA